MNAVCLVVLSILAQISAPTTDQEAKAKAQVVLKEGAHLYQQGAYADALEKFEQAYSVFPSPKLFFDIGQANRELGRPAEAVAAFERFLAEAVDASPELISDARRSVNELAPKIGKLIIDCDATGAEITVDGKVVGRAPLANSIPVSPGSHQVTATHPTIAPVVQTVEVAAGTLQTLALQPRTLTPSPVSSQMAAPPSPAPAIDLQASKAPATSTPDNGWWPGRKWTWVAAGSTVAFLGVAAISGSMMQSKYNDLRTSCGKGAGANWTGCNSDEISSLNTRKDIANGFWGLSAATAVTTGVLFFVEGHGVTVAPMAVGTTGFSANVGY